MWGWAVYIDSDLEVLLANQHCCLVATKLLGLSIPGIRTICAVRNMIDELLIICNIGPCLCIFSDPCLKWWAVPKQHCRGLSCLYSRPLFTKSSESVTSRSSLNKQLSSEDNLSHPLLHNLLHRQRSLLSNWLIQECFLELILISIILKRHVWLCMVLWTYWDWPGKKLSFTKRSTDDVCKSQWHKKKKRNLHQLWCREFCPGLHSLPV